MRRAVMAGMGLVVLLGGVAQAAPGKGNGGPAKADDPPVLTYYSGDGGTCVAGATCTGRGTADAGHVVASSDYARSSVADGEEYENGYGGVTFSRYVAPGTQKVTATFTWLVSGSTSAAGKAGQTYGEVWAETWSNGCGRGCTATATTAVVADTFDSYVVPRSTDPASVTGQQVVLTLTFTGSMPRYLTGGSTVVAGSGGRSSNLCAQDGLPGCGVDTGHAGTGHAELDAQLQSVGFSTS